MKLLTSVLPRGARLLPSGVWFTLALCGFLVGLEFAGRHATSDLHDGLAGFLLLGAGLAIAAVTRARLWVGFAGLRTGSVASVLPSASLRYDHGIDLRGTPPLPRRTPPAVWLVMFGLAVWGSLAAGAWAAFPTGWRVSEPTPRTPSISHS